MKLTHFRPVFPFDTPACLMLEAIQSLRNATMDGRRLNFVKMHYRNRRIIGVGVLYSVRITQRLIFLYFILFGGVFGFFPLRY